MTIQLLDKSYLVLEAATREDSPVSQYICRLPGEADGREYHAARIPVEFVTPDLIRYLLEQVKNESFHEFVDYSTDAGFITVLMDCKSGRSLEERLAEENMELKERLAIARELLSHLVLAGFPPYFVHAAMDIRRIRVNAAMEFGFSFDLFDLLSFRQISFSSAFRDLGDVLEELFRPELKKRALPDMESFLYRLHHENFSELLSVYESFEDIYREWSVKDETAMENRSPAFSLWERIKRLGTWLKFLVKAGVLLLAVGYLALSVYQFVQPESPGPVYEKIGDLEIH